MMTAERPAPEKAPASIADVRAWARKHGYPVGQRGHLPEQVIRRYNRFHHRKVAEGSNPWTGKRGES